MTTARRNKANGVCPLALDLATHVSYWYTTTSGHVVCPSIRLRFNWVWRLWFSTVTFMVLHKMALVPYLDASRICTCPIVSVDLVVVL